MLAIDIEGRAGVIDLSFHQTLENRTTLLVGPNGAGKTSLLLFLLGELRPNRGRITLHGRVLFDSERSIDVPIEERKLGYVPQSYALFPHMTALENVVFAVSCREPERSKSERQGLGLSTLKQLDVEHVASRRASELSGGEKQRVAVARVLASKPEALLLDEPFSAIDPGSRKQIRAFFAEHLATLEIPCIVVTHEPSDALAFGAEICVLEEGLVTQRGTWSDLNAHPRTAFIERFVSASR